MAAQKEIKYGVEWEQASMFGGTCYECKKDFGMLGRRTNCRMCGHVVCGDCQHPELVSVPGSSNKKTVCRPCWSPVAQASPATKIAVAASFGADGPVAAASSAPAAAAGSAAPAAPAAQPKAAAAAPPREAEGNCGVCNETCDEEYIVLPGGDDGREMRIHQQCFVCCIDAAPIEGEYFPVDKEDGAEGPAFCCDEHYAENFCEPCGGCSLRIRDGVTVHANGDAWHSECFACAKCCVPLASQREFKFRNHDNSVYCEQCYVDTFAKMCAGCGFAVPDRWLNAQNKHWHEECFVCEECREPVVRTAERSWCEIDGLTYCLRDAELLREMTKEDRERLRQLPPPQPPLELGAEPTNEELGELLSRGMVQSLQLLHARRQSEGSKVIPKEALQVVDYKHKEQLVLTREAAPGMAISEQAEPVDFEAFAPKAFQAIRGGVFGVSEEDFVKSISLRPLSGGKQGEGKSGQLFFFSWDRKYIVKTVPPVEVPFFRKCLKSYHDHFAHGGMLPDGAKCGGLTASLLPRFLGFYATKFAGEPKAHVVVMANVFPLDVKLVQMYDLKGVMGSNRFVTEEQQAQGVKTLKDRNFVSRSLTTGPSMKQRLEQQIKRDVKFLQEHDRIDYSLLLGVARGDAFLDRPAKDRPASEPENQWPTPECGGLPSRVWSAKNGLLDGDEVFFMGIIDILQEYTYKKALEGRVKDVKHFVLHVAKKSSLANSTNAVSACSAGHYAKRFEEFIVGKME